MGNEKTNEQADQNREVESDKETYIWCTLLNKSAREGVIKKWQKRWQKETARNWKHYLGYLKQG